MTLLKCMLRRTGLVIGIPLAVFTFVTLCYMVFAPNAYAETKREVIVDCDSDIARRDQVIALACNIYHEARSESQPGMWLVALATLNRVESKIYPDTFAKVVYEIRKDARTGKRVAMFSWVLDGKEDKVYNMKMWLTAVQIASRVVGHHAGDTPALEPVVDITFGCMWYHHVGISPYWKSSYYRTVRIQNHQCYAVNERAYLNELQSHLPVIDPMK